jgi:hypothetical protein
MTGKLSPEEGITRVSIVDDSLAALARDALIGQSNPVAPTPSKRATLRRVISLILKQRTRNRNHGKAVCQTACGGHIVGLHAR